MRVRCSMFWPILTRLDRVTAILDTQPATAGPKFRNRKRPFSARNPKFPKVHAFGQESDARARPFSFPAQPDRSAGMHRDGYLAYQIAPLTGSGYAQTIHVPHSRAHVICRPPPPEVPDGKPPCPRTSSPTTQVASYPPNTAACLVTNPRPSFQKNGTSERLVCGWVGGAHAHGNAARHVVDDLDAEGSGSKIRTPTPATTSTTSSAPITGRRLTRQRRHTEHRPQRPSERIDPTPCAKGRTGDCPGPRKETATRRNVPQGGGGA